MAVVWPVDRKQDKKNDRRRRRRRRTAIRCNKCAIGLLWQYSVALSSVKKGNSILTEAHPIHHSKTAENI